MGTTMCKTPKGAIGAYRWENGIAVGIHGEGNFASFEYDISKNELVLLINKDEMKRQGFKLRFVDKDWRY